MSGILRAVVEHAMTEAEENEARATKLEAEAADLRKIAGVLKDLHRLAEPHVVRPGVMQSTDDRS